MSSMTVEPLRLGLTPKCPRCGMQLRYCPRRRRASKHRGHYWCAQCEKWIPKKTVEKVG